MGERRRVSREVWGEGKMETEFTGLEKPGRFHKPFLGNETISQLPFGKQAKLNLTKSPRTS